MKRGLMYCWEAAYENAVLEAFVKAGVNLDFFKYPISDYDNDQNIMNAVENYFKKYADTDSPCEFVFSVNYIPVLSKVCDRNKVRYISWSVDSPLATIYSKTITNECNYFFTFDKAQMIEAMNLGALYVRHMPLGTGMKDLGEPKEYKSDISFMGNLYNTENTDMFSRIHTFPDWLSGYFNGIMQAQLQIYGYNFLNELISEEIWKETRKAVTIENSPEYVDAYKQHFLDMLNRHISRLERKKVLETIGNRRKIDLYTGSDISELAAAGIVKMGYADYFKDMPFIFNTSKINLNITSKSIATGIPLRVFDIMGCGGFVLSNYQPDLAELFENGKEVVLYESIADMEEKIEYYLIHEEERKEIARRGCKKVQEKYRFEMRVGEILKSVFEDGE